MLKCYQRLVIYLPPQSQLLTYANNIVTSVIEARKVVKGNFGRIKITSIDEQRAFSAIDSEGQAGYISAVKEADKANTMYWDSMRPHMESFIENYRGYSTALNINFQEQQLQPNKVLHRTSR